MNPSTWEIPSNEPTKVISSEKTICIGTGTAGCRIGTEIVSAEVPIHQFLMVSTDKEDFSDSQLANKILRRNGLPKEVVSDKTDPLCPPKHWEIL